MFSGDVLAVGAPGILAQAADAGDEASSRLTMVIIGLLVLAVVITILTVVFWRMTRPDSGEDGSGMRWSVRPSPASQGDAAEES